MLRQEQTEREIAAMLMAAVNEEASAGQLDQLNRALTERPELADFVVDVMSQESWLNWHSTRSRNGEIRTELLERIADVVQLAAAEQRYPDSDIPAGNDALLLQRRLRTGQTAGSLSPRRATRGSRLVLGVAAMLLVAVGMLLGFSFANWRSTHWLPSGDLAVRRDRSFQRENYVARYVHGTACLWSQEINSALSLDDALRTGESLTLLEGLAELQLDWQGGSASLIIEGPAGLVLTAERGASLSHGRFTADIEASGGHFSLCTPNGLIEVTGTASLGVAITGGDVDLHVFRGSAAFVGTWSRSLDSVEPVDIVAGEAIRIAYDVDGRVRLTRDIASTSSFTSKVSMGSDHLVVSPEYVREVISASPLVYWRFEDTDPAQIANEMGSKYHAVLTGEAERIRQGGNTSLELGGGLSDLALQSYVFCDEPLDADFSSGYTLETWFKPSHYHWGSLVGFLGDPDQTGRRPPHGFLLEIGGPRSSDTEIEHPGRVRYLHRNPPGDDLKSGTSCFSVDAYELRKWQHVAAVKTESELRLYINAQLVARGEDPSPLAPGMKVILGQLDREQFYRKFIGQIDEFAIYPRPLTEEEVARHYKRVRPTWQPPVQQRTLEDTSTAQAAEPSNVI